jgi:hypothetical protein
MKDGVWPHDAVTGHILAELDAQVSLSYFQFVNHALAGGPTLTNSQIQNISMNRADSWLQEGYFGGSDNTTLCQTRIASSYGFLQVMYPTSLMMKYPENSIPENFQLQDMIFPLAARYLQGRLDKQREQYGDPENSNWNLGFEETWRIALNLYNGKPYYDKDKSPDDPSNSKYSWKYGQKVQYASRSYWGIGE